MRSTAQSFSPADALQRNEDQTFLDSPEIQVSTTLLRSSTWTRSARKPGLIEPRSSESPITAAGTALAIRTERATGDDAVHVGVEAQVAGPGVQHGGETQLCAESLLVVTQLEQRLAIDDAEYCADLFGRDRAAAE